MEASERKLAAIMFTDMVGYSALGQKNESLSLALVQEQQKLLRPIFARHKGREVKTMGDAFLVEFPSALEAVRCAYDVQRESREFNISLPNEKRIHLRIGVHVGDVVESAGDIFGDAVNLASRIEPLAEDGGVCLTQQVYDQVRNKFELPLVSLGTKSLKNIGEPLEVYRMAMPWVDEQKAPPTELDKKRIAVLPFANMSPDRDDEYFADGMTEELISTSSAITGLTVIARTSVMRYKGLVKGVPEIGKELRVGSLLEGSVRKAGNRLRITVQLIDVQSEGHLWAQSYDRGMEDIFKVQTEIAKHVAEALQVKLLDREKRVMEARSTGSTEAYNSYLKGRYFWNERTQEGLKKAIGYFEHAIEKDPNYALAYAGLAESYAILANYGFVPSAEALPKAKTYAIKALELDEALAEAHSALATVLYNEWDLKGAGRELRAAIRLNPSYATAHQWYADYLVEFEHKADESLAEKIRARELDPFSPLINLNVGAALYYMRQYDKALEELQKAVEMFPEFWNLHLYLAGVYTMMGRRDEALAEVQKLQSLSKDKGTIIVAFGWVYGFFGERGEALKKIEELRELSKKEYVSAVSFALIPTMMGDKDEAFRWLDKAVSERSADLHAIIFDPTMIDKLGADPRWPELLKKMGVER